MTRRMLATKASVRAEVWLISEQVSVEKEGLVGGPGMSPTETKDLLGTKAGTYHWDIGDAAYPHDASHLQVHTRGGDVIRIFFPD